MVTVGQEIGCGIAAAVNNIAIETGIDELPTMSGKSMDLS
jgi:hypothetical protein